MKKLNTEEFVRRAKEVHGNTYDYSLSEYTHSANKVKIICKLHGVFEQNPTQHVKGASGCGVCTHLTASLEDFVKSAKGIHGERYDYSQISFTSDRKKVKIICKEHGEFEQARAHHLQGKNCRKCAGKDVSTEDFIFRSRAIHGDLYDYSKSVYTKAKDNITIICKEHGEFRQAAFEHSVTGHRCPNCSKSGYRAELPGALYILKYDNVTKVGITNRHVPLRVREIIKSSKKNFELEFFIKFEDGLVAHNVENNLLTHLLKTYKSVPEVYDGSTECFLDVDYKSLLLEATKLCAEFLPTK